MGRAVNFTISENVEKFAGLITEESKNSFEVFYIWYVHGVKELFESASG